MKTKSIKTICVFLSIIAFISNLIFIGFSLDSCLFDINWRIFTFTVYHEELFHAITSFCVIISILVITKTKLPVLVSFCLIVVADVFRFANVLKNYSGLYSYTYNILLYNLIALTVLTIVFILVCRNKVNKQLIIKLSKICIILYLIVCLLPVILFDSYINITLAAYYISIYALFGTVTWMIQRSASDACRLRNAENRNDDSL